MIAPLKKMIRTFKGNKFTLEQVIDLSGNNPTDYGRMAELMGFLIELTVISRVSAATYVFQDWILTAFQNELIDKMAEETGHAL